MDHISLILPYPIFKFQAEWEKESIDDLFNLTSRRDEGKHIQDLFALHNSLPICLYSLSQTNSIILTTNGHIGSGFDYLI